MPEYVITEALVFPLDSRWLCHWKPQLPYLNSSQFFSVSQILDADNGERLESSTGRVASRDIVQFVPFRNVQSKKIYYCDK